MKKVRVLRVSTLLENSELHRIFLEYEEFYKNLKTQHDRNHANVFLMKVVRNMTGIKNLITFAYTEDGKILLVEFNHPADGKYYKPKEDYDGCYVEIE